MGSDEVEEVERDEQRAVESTDRSSVAQTKALDQMSSRGPEQAVEMDASRVKRAMSELISAQQTGKAAAAQREWELATIKISKEDIEIVVTEMEVDKKTAERRLRECGGDLEAALRSLM